MYSSFCTRFILIKSQRSQKSKGIKSHKSEGGRGGLRGAGGRQRAAVCARRVRDHHPGGRQGVLEPRQEAERGRGGRAAGHPVPHRPVLHLAAAPRCECCGRAGRGARRAAWGSPPRPQFLLDIARQKNQTPLPLIKPYSGPRLPPDRYCLTAPNYRLKSLQKKVRGRQGCVC